MDDDTHDDMLSYPTTNYFCDCARCVELVGNWHGFRTHRLPYFYDAEKESQMCS